MHQIEKAAMAVNIETIYLRGGYRILQNVRTALLESYVIKSGWYNYRSRFDDIKPPDLQKEITYDDCIDGEYNLNKGELCITMWDGDAFDGQRGERRCHWDIKIPKDTDYYATHIVPVINHALFEYCERKHEENEAKKKVAAITKIYNHLLIK